MAGALILVVGITFGAIKLMGSSKTPQRTAPLTGTAASASPSPSISAPSGALASGATVFTVGEDISPGLYAVTVTPGAYAYCRVTQEAGDSMLNRLSADGGRQLFEVLGVDGSKVTTQGCANVVPFDSAKATPPASLDDGSWLVGKEIKAGTYSAKPGPGMLPRCRVEQSKNGKSLASRHAEEGRVLFQVLDEPNSIVSFGNCREVSTVDYTKATKPETITNGNWFQGTEVAAGTYIAYKGPGERSCVVSQDINGKLAFSEYLQADKVIFTVFDEPGSILEFRGCKDIGILDPAKLKAPATLTDGYWYVGAEIPAGTYKAVDGNSYGCTMYQMQAGTKVARTPYSSKDNPELTIEDVPDSYVVIDGCKDITKVN